jgi:hypothetical protein
MRAARDHTLARVLARPVQAAIVSHDPGTTSAPARIRVCRVARRRDSDSEIRRAWRGAQPKNCTTRDKPVELNDIEVVWHDLKAYHLAHQTFTGVAALDQAIHTAVEDLNREPMVVPLAKPRISV